MKIMQSILRRIHNSIALLSIIAIRCIAIVATIFILVPSPSIAQEKVGTAFVDGQRVDLFSDRSWRYASSSGSAECITIKANVDFCGQELGWRIMRNNDPEIDAHFILDDKNYGILIIENLGLSDGMTTEMMMSFVIENFAKATGIKVEDVVIFDVEEGVFSALPVATITYGGNYDGLNVIFKNTVIVNSNISVQVATYTIGPEVTDSFERLHNEFVSATVLN